MRTDAADERRDKAEIFFAVLFSLRQMSNLGSSPQGHALGKLLVANAREIVFSPGENTVGLHLVPYKGAPASKRFVTTARFDDSSASLDLKSKGFGFLGRGLGYYSPMSVAALLMKFAADRKDSKDFLLRLANVAESCGEAHLARRVGMTNQIEVARHIVRMYG